MKKLIASILVIAMSGFVLSSSNAENLPDEQISAPLPPGSGGGYTGLYLDDTTNFTGFPTYLAGISYVSHRVGAKAIQSWGCAQWNDANCSKADSFNMNAYLSPCLNESQVNCLEGLEATNSNGVIESASLVRNYPDKFPSTFSGDPGMNIPDGGSPSLWKFPTIKHQGGELFLATPAMTFSDWQPSLGPAKPQLLAGIYPVGLNSSGETSIPTINTGMTSALGFAMGAMETTPNCAMRDGQSCAKIFPFPKDTKFSMKIRTAIPINGFMHGRLKDPIIDLTNSGGVTTLTLTALPIEVPIFAYWAKNSDLPPVLNSILDAQQMGGRFYYSDGSGTRAGTALLRDGRNTGYSTSSITEFSMWLPLAKDTAYATKSVWGFHTMASYNSFGNCFDKSNELQGLVTTNATMYEESPPQFDRQMGTLNYQVAAPHFNKTGNVNIGSYTLLLKSSVARCIYNFTSAPIKASVSVVSSNGSNQLSSIVVNESNGWLSLNAGGFTYSNPTVQVKLTQDIPVAEPITTVLKGNNGNPTKKITITCVKGKTSKKVTAIKPTCPSGFKKK